MITKKLYYKRLKDVIENCEEVCSICPMWKKEGNKWRSNIVIKSARGGFVWQVLREVCEMCRDFLTKKKFQRRGLIRCPCIALGSKRAVRRAKEAIARYERGEHRWQKEKRKAG